MMCIINKENIQFVKSSKYKGKIQSTAGECKGRVIFVLV